MNHERMWADLKAYLKALAESIEGSVGARPYAGAETDELFKAYREAAIECGQKDQLKLVNDIVALMEWMEEYR